MQYTMSKDGNERANINITIRLTREEYANMSRMVREMESESLREYARSALLDHLFMTLPERYKEFLTWPTADEDEEGSDAR